LLNAVKTIGLAILILFGLQGLCVSQTSIRTKISVVSVEKAEVGRPFRYSLKFSNGLRADGQIWPGDTPKLEELILSASEGDDVELIQLRGAPLACSDIAAKEHGLGIWEIKLGTTVAKDILTLTGTQRLCGVMGIEGLRFPDRSEMSQEEKVDIQERLQLLEENN